MIIARRIKELRMENGLTQVELAKIIGYSQSMIVLWEKEKCEPTATAILKLANTFKCSCDYLLGKTDI